MSNKNEVYVQAWPEKKDVADLAYMLHLRGYEITSLDGITRIAFALANEWLNPNHAVLLSSARRHKIIEQLQRGQHVSSEADEGEFSSEAARELCKEYNNE